MNVKPDTDEYERILSEVLLKMEKCLKKKNFMLLISRFKTHLRCANRIKDVCCKNGGCFIKVGQHIGGLDYLLPSEYVNTMKVLHNQAPQSNVKELFETIETDLKCKVSSYLIFNS